MFHAEDNSWWRRQGDEWVTADPPSGLAQTIKVECRVSRAQADTIIAAAGWIERISNRKDTLPLLFLDNTDPAPIAKKLRKIVKESQP